MSEAGHAPWPPEGGQLSVNGVKRWGPRLPASPRRAELARRTVIDLVLKHDPCLMQAAGGMLRQASQCATGCAMSGAGALCGR